ncbi:hypothetical protein PBAL39_07080 [Pedobacter sp. BAL39]|uniref:hypothetical protein n=1 Tax=Pedobacter sp. BAL39 TaxID=391596 RepID=UPI000155B180|nr:hypothetical protein [Pedobacter sp. BAL39]EDM34046.1 hypothetical protein PBAL39_07080 [Pedobacter sp. BAL39]
MNFKRNKIYFSALFMAVLGLAACSKDSSEGEGPSNGESVVLKGQITTATKLDANKTYVLSGYVRVMDGASIEIPAGTVIKGETSSKGALIIERGGKIYANGTATNPVIFTSDRPVNERKEGDWAGVIICGKSTVNTADGTALYEGGSLGTGVASYGGTVANDNSGSFTYVRIEFSGLAIEKDKEINGLTLCGVGSGTTIHHVQVSYGGDDSFEFFGGTVNATHLIAYRGVDDDFDFDQGFTGKLQYGISIKDPLLADLIGTSRGIELENKGAVTGGLYSRPVLSNFTFIGPGTTNALSFHGAGIHFGQNSRMVLANSIIVNARTNAVEFNTDFPALELKQGRSILSNNLVFGNTADYGMSSVTAFVDAAALRAFATTAGNVTLANAAAAGITSISLDAPNLLLASNSVALGKAAYTGDLATGFTQETFVGAMGTSTNWTAGWASWTPKTNVY